MAQRFDTSKLNREIRAAQRKAEAALKREVDRADREYRQEVARVNRENQRRVDAHNRTAEQHNRRVMADHNRDVDRVNRHNAAVVGDLKRQLVAASGRPQYTASEQGLAERVRHAIAARDDRKVDVFLSYARIDGADVGATLCRALENRGVRVWFDAIAITPGTSQALQMDRGLQRARVGIVVLTPAYVAGRFWTERELGALLHKSILIPVLHSVTFAEVREYSGILPDLAGFETSRDSVDVIADKIAAVVEPVDAAI
jgi:hypothetical protein